MKVNLLGLAAVAVPSTAAPSGQPFGVTVVGPPSHEAHLVALAASLEEATVGTWKKGVSRA